MANRREGREWGDACLWRRSRFPARRRTFGTGASAGGSGSGAARTGPASRGVVAHPAALSHVAPVVASSTSLQNGLARPAPERTSASWRRFARAARAWQARGGGAGGRGPGSASCGGRGAALRPGCGGPGGYPGVLPEGVSRGRRRGAARGKPGVRPARRSARSAPMEARHPCPRCPLRRVEPGPAPRSSWCRSAAVGIDRHAFDDA
jgi:hypothetical protein